MATNAAQRLSNAPRPVTAALKKPVSARSIEERLARLKERRTGVPATTKAKTKVNAVEVPKFRYIDDVTRFLDDMRQSVDETSSLINVQQRMLARLLKPFPEKVAAALSAVKAALTFNISDDAGDKKSYLKRKIDPELTKVVVPNMADLKKQYGLAEDLYEKHRMLEAVGTQMSMQFQEKNRGEAYKQAEDSLKMLKAKVDGELKKVLAFLNEVASKHVPKTFMRYRQAIMQEIEEHVMFESSNQFMYVNTTDDGDLVFTNYIMLVNATNLDGNVTPHLYISIQWIVGEHVQVQVNHEFELPAILLREGGTAVSSVGEAVKAISELLDLEDFATSLGTVPLSTQLKDDPSQISEQMFSYKERISKVNVDQDSITFNLRPGTSNVQAQEMSRPLYLEVKQLFRNSRGVRLRVAISSRAIKFTLVNLAERGQVSLHDAEFLAQKFGLNDSQLRKVVNILNEGDTK
jgi:hypothetical protein